MSTSIGRKTPPKGVVVTQRLQSAGVRALDAHRRARMIAEMVNEELDETTAPHGIPVAFLKEEDSLVTTVKEALGVHEQAAAATAANANAK